MTWSTFLCLACLLLARLCNSTADPTFFGDKYLITSEDSNKFLGCGSDFLCSMSDMANAVEADGWTETSTQGYVQFIGNDGQWALDVQDTMMNFSSQTGYKVFANTNTTVSVAKDFAEGQLWTLSSWPDGSYQIKNLNFKNFALDVDDSVTPFVNSNSTNTGLSGQKWFFWSVNPQVTQTSTVTAVVTANTLAVSTVTVTTTVCVAQKRDAHVNGTPLAKRTNTGSALTSTTTIINTVTVTSTLHQTTGSSVITSTNTVTSCAPSTTSSSSTLSSSSTSSSSSTPTASGATNKSGAMRVRGLDLALGLVVLGMILLMTEILA